MSLSADKVVAASNAWTWIPDNATTAAAAGVPARPLPRLLRPPGARSLLRFTPAAESGPALATAVETVLERARQFGVGDLYWWVRLDSPPEVADLLVARWATVEETLDVLAVDLQLGRARARRRRSGEVGAALGDRGGDAPGRHSGGRHRIRRVHAAGGAPEGGGQTRSARPSRRGDGGMVVAYVDRCPGRVGRLSPWPTAWAPPVGRRGPRSRPRPGRVYCVYQARGSTTA